MALEATTATEELEGAMSIILEAKVVAATELDASTTSELKVTIAIEVAPTTELCSSGLGNNNLDTWATLVANQHATESWSGFNEPNLNTQSNLSPTDAANLWMQYMEPLKKSNVRLGAPAPTNGDGFPWLASFLDASDLTEVANFMSASIAYLDTLDFIERYAWFGFFREETNSHYSLMDVNGNLNALGKIYAAYP
ncbi:glycosyl hydrolase catalytic core-domain-containing protein [Mycena floridula]|nr:glycosyl hydrolase catalytic core-domain-containing protein [Mycena floridula]